MAQLKAKNVRIFPISNRTVNTGNNFATEYNIASIINQLTGSTGFVITEVFEEGKEFSFNIAGYCFTVDEGKLLTALAGENNELYAYITFTYKGNADDPVDYRKINGEDAEDTSFVQFDTKNPGNSYPYKLKILYRESEKDAWKIPDESRIKFIMHKDFNIDNGRIK